MAKIVVEQIPVLSDNYVYLVHEPLGGATAAVDPAVPEPVLERLADKGWTLTHILNTHHHGDHTGANLELARRTGCAVIGAARDSQRIPGITQEVAEGDIFMLGHAAVTVLEVPGHTSGHIAYWFADSHVLFPGDTLFSLGCGRLFEGSAEEMWTSLRKLRDLPPRQRGAQDPARRGGAPARPGIAHRAGDPGRGTRRQSLPAGRYRRGDQGGGHGPGRRSGPGLRRVAAAQGRVLSFSHP
jgi:glyoxylase-like metal-dependent hydrolase (beta-lactamase superfamily II)